MRKKTLISLLLGIVLIMSCFIVACDKKPKVKLVDFESYTETVSLGENYTLPNGVVFDEEGAYYRVIYEVKNSAGEEVNVVNRKFKATEIGKAKYVITCYAEITEDYYITRTITLNVIDRTAPEIVMLDLPYAFVGQEYTISGVNITDNAGEIITPVYSVKDPNGASIVVTNGKFTPTTMGEYTLTVTATDSDGNSNTESGSIYVREYMGAYVIENFNDTYGLPVFSVYDAAYTNKEIVYHETFEGKTGVAEGTSNLADSASYGPHWYFKFTSAFNKENIGDFEYIYLNVYIKSVSSEVTSVTLYNQNEALGDGTAVPVNEWVQVKLTKEDIMSADSAFYDSKKADETPIDCFFRKMTTGNGSYLFWFSKGSVTADNYTLYVDEIGYKPAFNPTVELEDSYSLGETITLNPTVKTDEDASDYEIGVSVTDPSGNAVALTNNQFRIIEQGEYVVELTYTSENGYTGYNKYIFESVADKEITIGEVTGSYAQGDTVTLPNATINGGTVSISVFVEGYPISMATANTFVAIVAGEYTVVYSAEIDGLTYKKAITVTVASVALEQNIVNSYSSKADFENYMESYDSTLTWLPEFEGKAGVVKYEAKSWGFFGFVPMQDMANYQGAKYLVVRMYVATTDYDGALWFGGANGKCSTAIQVGTWVDYCFDGAFFLQNWANSQNSYDIWSMAMSVSKPGTFYVDEVYVLYDCSVLDLESTVTGTLFAGETLSVTLNNPNNVDGVTISVTDPLGNDVDDITSFVAVPGRYTISISKDGYEDYVDTFVVARPVDENEVIDFKYANDVEENAFAQQNVTLSFLNEFQGANGVLKIEQSANWGRWSFNHLQDLSAYNGATYLVVRMWVESTYVAPENYVYMALQASSSDHNPYKSITAIETGKWVDYYFKGSDFTTQWQQGWRNYYSAIESSRKSTCYVDKIYVAYDCASLGLSATISGQKFIGETLSVTLNNSSNVDGVTLTVKAPNGSNVANLSSFVAEKGVYTVTISKDGYLDTVTTFTVTRPVTANEVLSFDYASDVDNFILKSSTAGTKTYLDSYDGETGVLKYEFISTDDTWNWFSFKPIQEMANYANYQYIVIRAKTIKASDPDNYTNYIGSTGLRLINDGTLLTYPNGYQNWTYDDTWINYVFDATNFKAVWTDENLNTGKAQVYFNSAVKNATGCIYISDIYMTNDING